MPRNPNKQPCSHPGCRAFALRGGRLCSVHAGRARRSARPPAEVLATPEPRPEARRLPTLEDEISLLAARRDEVDRRLRERLDGGEWQTAEALRYLTVLSQVGKSLATMLVQRQAFTGAADLERFFDAVSQRMEELEPGGDNETQG